MPSTERRQTVAVLGASNKPDRYANKAVKLLLEHGHEVIPVHPRLETVEGLPVRKDLASIGSAVDTLTLYVGPERSDRMADAIVQLKPGRVIFNPGTENDSLEARLEEAGIPFRRACTLVLLKTGQFDTP